MRISPYYADGTASAAFYDIITAADHDLAGDADLYAALVPAGGSVLELGSGTGRISESLAARGLDVTGLEISRDMLRQAIARMPTGQRLRYHEGDMRSFDFERNFDAVICPFFALAHLPPDSWPKVLANVRSHLATSGKAAFHMPIARKMAEPAPPMGATVFRSGALTLQMAGKLYDAQTGRMDLDVTYIIGSNSKTERITYYAGDLVPIAKEVGLQLVGKPTPLGNSGLVYVFEA